MLTPPKRQSKAIMADSLFPKDRKKQETQDMTLEPAGVRKGDNNGPSYIGACYTQPSLSSSSL